MNDGNGVTTANGGRTMTPRLPLSPNAIRSKRFQSQGRRGYERSDVDYFISQVAADVQLWIDEVTRQRAEIERLKNWIRAQHYRGNGNGGPDPDMRISAEAVGVLARAQHQADLVVATAHDQARAIVGDAGAQAQAIVDAARMEADRAAQAYRAEGEDLRRRLAILQTFLGTLTAVQAQLPAVESQLGGLVAAFGYEVERLRDMVEGDGHYDPRPISPAYGILR